MKDRTVVEWNKDDLDALGILKVDCLALGMLTAIKKCFELLHRHHGRRLTLATVPQDDADVYEMISRADTVGVFQIESRAQMSMLPRLKPRIFYDLVIEVAIVRPGPIQGNMVHPYLRRRNNEEEVTYPDERIRHLLMKTYGVPIFQEQAMRIAMVAANFTADEADQLRRAMGGWRRPGIINQFEEKLINGMMGNGYSETFAEQLFNQIKGFGEYGFPESHAASFALLVYVSAWLKHHYPAAFTAALLNSQPMGFYAPAQLVRDARQHGVKVLPVDINVSEWPCTLERTKGQRKSDQPALRLGFSMIKGCSEKNCQQIVKLRGIQPFRSVEDFAQRTGSDAGLLNRLSKANAFESCGLTRRGALWQSLPDYAAAPLLDTQASAPEYPVPLPELEAFEEVAADYRATSLSLRGHPIQFIRPLLNRRRVTSACSLRSARDGCFLRVAGLVLMRQRPSTAKNITFFTLEDETGIVNLVVHIETWNRYRRAAREATVLIAHGVLERRGDVIHVVAGRLEDISYELSEVQVKSRDFH